MLPVDIANRSLDAIGADFILGDMEEGSREAQVILRNYGECMRQLLRAAHWDFARKTAPLTLLADATGSTASVGTIVPVPWIYEYAYPTDCMKVRFIPQNYYPISQGGPAGNISIPSTPLMTGLQQAPLTGLRIVPARFTVATDFNYPVQGDNQIPGGNPAAWWDIQGVGPAERTVVLTNVCQAQCIYTALLTYPNMWDALFREAMVAYLAQKIALPLTKDKKFGMRLRDEQIQIAKDSIKQARLTDGNEGWFSSDLKVDWMRIRNSGSQRGTWDGGGGYPGALWGGWDQCSFSDGSAY